MTKKRPKFGVLPTLNMPKKSHQSEKPAPRRPILIVKDRPIEERNKAFYDNFVEVCKRVRPLKTLREWTVQEQNDTLLLRVDVYKNRTRVGHSSKIDFAQKFSFTRSETVIFRTVLKCLRAH